MYTYSTVPPGVRFFRIVDQMKSKSGYRLHEGAQVPTRGTTIEEIMSSPYFALGVADVRARRGFRADYDTWAHANAQWDYDRGRQWATVAPKSIPLKRNGKITREAMRLYKKHHEEIL
jgi:hypothetical protein